MGFTLYGCAEIPERIALAPAGDLQLDKAVTDIAGNVGQPVRWGGTVLTVTEEEGQSWAEIQQYKLDKYGSPRQSNDSMGRFLVKTAQLSGKSSMLSGRDVTVFGALSGSFDGSIGREPYQFPVVNAEEHYLWGPNYSAAYPRYYDGYSRYLYPYHLGSYPYPGYVYHPYTHTRIYHSLRPFYHHGLYYY